MRGLEKIDNFHGRHMCIAPTGKYVSVYVFCTYLGNPELTWRTSCSDVDLTGIRKTIALLMM